MTQPAQGQGPPTIPKSEEIGPMSGPEPETTTTADEEENIESDKDVQVRTLQHAMAGTHLLHWMWRARAGPPSLTLQRIALHLLVQARLGEAEELKKEGNDLFRHGEWIEALHCYRNGLARLPKRRDPVPSPPPASSSSPGSPTTDDAGDPPSPLAEGQVHGASADANNQSEPSDHVNTDSPLERECAKARSVLHANIAACHLKMASAHTHTFRTRFLTHSLQGENENAVKACTEGSHWAL